MGYCYSKDGDEVVVERLTDKQYDEHKMKNGCNGDCWHCSRYMADE